MKVRVLLEVTVSEDDLLIIGDKISRPSARQQEQWKGAIASMASLVHGGAATALGVRAWILHLLCTRGLEHRGLIVKLVSASVNND